MRPDKRWRDNNNKDLEREKTLRMKKMREEKRQNMVEAKIDLGKVIRKKEEDEDK